MNIVGQPIPGYTIVGTPPGGATAGAGVPLGFAVVGQLIPGVAIAAGAAPPAGINPAILIGAGIL